MNHPLSNIALIADVLVGVWLVDVGLWPLAIPLFGLAAILALCMSAPVEKRIRIERAPEKRCIVKNDPRFESGRVGRGRPR